MAITKNKILTRDNTLSLSAGIDDYYDSECYYYDDYYDYHYYNSYYYDCDCSSCRPLGWGEYDYLDIPTDYRTILGKTRGVWTRSRPLLSGRLINLDTVYSKEIMRDKKIDRILGLTIRNPTMGDIFYEEFRDIQRKLDNTRHNK